MDKYKQYLAEKILTQDQVVTYRYLSRALKVHVNVAKQMLYDFHKWQNDRRPGAIHATYLIYGVKQLEEDRGQSKEAEDVKMEGDTAEAEAQEDIVQVHTLSLVPEERLKEALEEFDTVASIQVYSIGPHPMSDLVLLADDALQISALPVADGSEAVSFGPIHNSYVYLREGWNSHSSTPAASIPSGTAAAIPKQQPPPQASALIKEENRGSQSSLSKTSTPSSTGPKKPMPSLKRAGSANSGIMQSFAKAAVAGKTKKAGASQATPSADDSSLNAMSDDGEDDTDAVPQPTAQEATGRKTRKEREAELKRMMEESDDEDADAKADTPMGESGEDEPEPEPEPEPEAEPEPAKEEPAEIVSASGDGRRRGKRRVMKKKQIMDEQGYLVTIQEQGWESFSEDDSAPPAGSNTKTAGSTPTTSQAAKAKKSGAPKGSQGSIMSFFSKK